MPFCPACGTKYEAEKFCVNCGQPLQEGLQPRTPVPGATTLVWPEEDEGERILWEAKPFMKQLASNMHYELTNERIIVTGGLLSRKEDQIELIRVKDIRVTQGLSDRALGISQIAIVSIDASTPILRLEGVKNASEVKETIRNAVKVARQKAGIVAREII